MSLKDFQTILVPSNKNGALQFYHKPTKAILEAAFSRPDIGASSGSMAFDKNGNLIEKAENEPDWSFDAGGAGCPKLLMRLQAQNVINESNDFSTYGTVGAPVVNSTTAEDPKGGNNASNVTMAATDRFFKTISLSGDVSVGIMMRGTGEYRIRDNSGTHTFFISPTSDYQIFSFSFNSSITNIQLECITGGTIDVYGFTVVNQPAFNGIIPTSGTALTRSANSITWNNMQSAGVLGSDEGAWLIKLKDYQSWANVSTFLRLDGDGSDTLRLSARTNNQLLLLFDAGSGTNSLGAAFNGQDAVISMTYDSTWLRLFVGAAKHAEIEHGGSLSLDNLRTNIASAFAEIALMAFDPVFLSDSQMIDANTEAQNL